MEEFDVIIIGGGASGLMCAASASGRGLHTVVLDGNRQPGRKLRITGKGRCNLTNSCDIKTFMENIPHGGKFLYSALNRFPPSAAVRFFEDNGLKTKVERGNRVFPVSDNANEVADTLIRLCRDGGTVFVKERAEKALRTENGFAVYTKEKTIRGRNLVLACGGMSYPLTGSDGTGYRIAESFGHTVSEPLPSLVPLVSDDAFCASLQGFSLKDIRLRAYENDKEVFDDVGEMLFTHFGVSGPLVLSASAVMRDFRHNRYRLSIDFKTALSEKQLDAKILKIFSENLNKTLSNVLPTIIGNSLAPVILTVCGLDGNIQVNSVTRQMRERLVGLLKDFPVGISCTRSIDEAIVTAGGVVTGEINPRTMESKLVPGLYFTGEIIDVDGYTGGFNLQIAWSTGFLAGQSIN